MLTRIIGFILCCMAAMAQQATPDLIWSHSRDAGENDYYISACLAPNSDFLLVGNNEFSFADSITATRLSRSGEIVWQRSYHNTVDRLSIFSAVAHNDEFWICGVNGISFGSSDAFIMRMSAQGDSLSFQTTGDSLYEFRGFVSEGHGDNPVLARSVAVDIDGEWQYRTAISFLDSTGRPISTNYIDAPHSEFIRDFKTAPDGFLLATFGEPPGDWIAHLVKLDIYGELMWRSNFSVPGYREQFMSSIHTRDGGYLACGGYSPNGQVFFQGLLVKFSPDGDSLWSQTYGGPNLDWFESVYDTDSGIVATGVYSISEGTRSFWLIRVDENGDSLTSNEPAYAINLPEQGIKVDSTILLYGSRDSSSYAALLGYAPVFSTPTYLLFPPTVIGDTSHIVFTFANTGSNTLRLDGIASADAFFSDFEGPVEVAVEDSFAVVLFFTPTVLGFTRDSVWIESNLPRRALACRGNGIQIVSTDDGTLLPQSFSLLRPYPNPFNATTTFEYELPTSSRVLLNVFDVQGRFVTTLVDETASAGVHSVRWACAECASGLYFVRMEAGEFVGVQKVLLVK